MDRHAALALIQRAAVVHDIQPAAPAAASANSQGPPAPPGPARPGHGAAQQHMPRRLVQRQRRAAGLAPEGVGRQQARADLQQPRVLDLLQHRIQDDRARAGVVLEMDDVAVHVQRHIAVLVRFHVRYCQARAQPGHHSLSVCISPSFQNQEPPRGRSPGRRRPGPTILHRFQVDDAVLHVRRLLAAPGSRCVPGSPAARTARRPADRCRGPARPWAGHGADRRPGPAAPAWP